MAMHDDVTQVDEIPQVDSGCTVDWSWLHGLQVESVTSDLQHWRIRFTNGQTLSIQAGNFQGKPFLAFDPWRAPSS